MTVAVIISRLLDPMWVMGAISILGAYRMDLRGDALWRIVLLISFVMIAPLVILRMYFARRKTQSGWDIKTLSHRPMIIGVLLVFGLVNIWLSYIFGNEAFRNLFIFYECWIAGFFLISLFWKISGHAGGLALATGLVILWYGWTWWPILLLIPLIGWARVVSRNHSTAQVIAGAIYSWGFLFVSRVMYQVP